MEQANCTGDRELHKKAETVFRQAVEAGWDKEYGGILYFIDCLGKPTEAYEHDMKLWWPHDELLIASLMAYRDTGEQYYLDWFFKALDYVRAHFADEEYGEWYGYLRRDGLPTMPPTKGSTFKGPFHLPRMLAMVDTMLARSSARADARVPPRPKAGCRPLAGGGCFCAGKKARRRRSRAAGEAVFRPKRRAGQRPDPRGRSRRGAAARKMFKEGKYCLFSAKNGLFRGEFCALRGKFC